MSRKQVWLYLSLKEKGNVMSCGSYKGVKLLKHAMKIVERVLER